VLQKLAEEERRYPEPEEAVGWLKNAGMTDVNWAQAAAFVGGVAASQAQDLFRQALVNFGKGCKALKSEPAGKNLVVTFDGNGNGLKNTDFQSASGGVLEWGDGIGVVAWGPLLEDAAAQSSSSYGTVTFQFSGPSTSGSLETS